MSAVTPSVLKISTPEGVSFSLALAGPVTRAVAMLIDFAVGLAINKIVNQLVAAISTVSMDAGMATGVLMQFVIMFGYATICELLFNGQTIGKRLLSIRVMDERGLRLRPGQVLIRNLLRFVDVLPYAYAVGGIFCMLSPRGQRLGDLAAGTIVVRTERYEPPAIDDVLGGKYNSFRECPHLQARLRQKVTPAVVQYALSSLIRNDDLTTEARLKLYSQMAAHFRNLVTFPEETTFGLTDEQYVRNVVDTIYHRDKPAFQR
ncbi:MAG: RDD family protein [Verrucomicrobiaceae bacterium]|nr:RDD family protein [Verrucomicrobiaceae bacterium]